MVVQAMRRILEMRLNQERPAARSLRQGVGIGGLLMPLFLLTACVGPATETFAPTCDRVSAGKQAAENIAASGRVAYMFNLGRMAELVNYCEESGGYVTLEPDFIAAYMWFEIALRHEHPIAAQARDRISTKLTESDIAKARKRVALWMEHHGKQR